MKFLLLVCWLVALVFGMNPACELCHRLVSIIRKTTPERPTQFVLDRISVAYCVKKQLFTRDVCRGAVKEMGRVVLPSLWKHYADPHLICPDLHICKKEYIPRNLKADIARIVKDKKQKEWENPTNRKTLKIMHVSDLHIDLFYATGSPSNCTTPVCCRVNATPHQPAYKLFSRLEGGEELVDSTPNDSPAGYWGSLNRCDLPIQTFNLFLKQVEKMNLDLIIWTGDNTPHDIWEQSQSYNLNYTVLMSQKFRRHTKTVVIPSMGNHESFPVNVYNYKGDREDVLKGGTALAWEPWVGQKAAKQIRENGFFSVTLPQLNNLKIISLNTQAQNDMNWFLLQDPTDPGGMLDWLEKELRESELIGQFVYIIGHISPRSAMNDWSMRFNALNDRYSYIIRGQYYGHQHTDHTILFFSMTQPQKLLNYGFISPSLKCAKHPQYRVLDVDYDTMQVIDYHQYYLNITTYTRKDQDAKFDHFYSFKQAYGLSDMTINGGMSRWNELMRDDPQTQKKYWYFLRSGLEKPKTGRGVYCDTKSSPQLRAKCNGKEQHTVKKSKLQKYAGPWRDLKHKEM